jgi:hypothetical protein
MLDMIILTVPFQNDFFIDIVLPSIAGGFVLILILNSVLNKFGFTLW